MIESCALNSPKMPFMEPWLASADSQSAMLIIEYAIFQSKNYSVENIATESDQMKVHGKDY